MSDTPTPTPASNPFTPPTNTATPDARPPRNKAPVLPPSPILPSDAPLMPGGPFANPTPRQGYASKFDQDAQEERVRSVAGQARGMVANALRSLNQTAEGVRAQIAQLNEEQVALWDSLAGLMNREEILETVAAFDDLAARFSK